MQRQRFCPINGTKLTDLFGERVAVRPKIFGRAARRGVVELGEFRAQRSNWAAEIHNLRSVDDQHMNEQQDAPARIFAFRLPPVEHGAGQVHSAGSHGIQYVVLGLEVMIEIPARDAHGFGDFGKGRGLESALVEEGIASSTIRLRVDCGGIRRGALFSTRILGRFVLGLSRRNEHHFHISLKAD